MNNTLILCGRASHPSSQSPPLPSFFSSVFGRIVGPVATFMWVMTTSSSAFAHQGHTNPTPWEVCASAETGSSCAWADTAGRVSKGTCREIGGAGMCVRTEPFAATNARAGGGLPLVGLLGLAAGIAGSVLMSRRHRRFQRGGRSQPSVLQPSVLQPATLQSKKPSVLVVHAWVTSDH